MCQLETLRASGTRTGGKLTPGDAGLLFDRLWVIMAAGELGRDLFGLSEVNSLPPDVKSLCFRRSQ